MSQANPLEVSGTGVMVPMLESMQCQLAAVKKLLALLRARGDEAINAAVEDQLVHVETHLQEALRCMHAPVPQPTRELSPTIPWIAASPSEDRQKNEAFLTLRERGDILSRAVQARRLHSNTVISAEHDPVVSQPY